MRRAFLIAVLFGIVPAFGLLHMGSVRAEQLAAEPGPAGNALPWEQSAAANAAPDAAPQPVAPSAVEAQPDTIAEDPERPHRVKEDPEQSSEDSGTPKEETAVDVTSEPAAAPPPPPHPVVAIVRDKLTDRSVTAGTDKDDIAGFQSYYETHAGPPLWVTEMGLSAKGQAVLFEIAKADDWGLEPKAFSLPEPGALPEDEIAQALAEIELSLAILKYARFARGGRYEPSKVSRLFDQTPPLRDPATVLAEIGESAAPEVYLRSLHPRHEQFGRLRTALAKAREADEPNETDIRRLIINMERWRWMPEDLGTLHVWLNTPEFMLYVLKDGEVIYEDKTLVGELRYSTPVFSADLETVVFNPNWTAPPSVLRDKLWPALKRKSYNILKSNKLNVSYRGKPVDPKKIDWRRVNIHNFTFTQKSGPKNVLGKAKFLYPNKHIVYMHDTLPTWDKTFKKDRRSVGNACVRMENPREFAALVLAEDQELEKSKVKSLWDKGINSSVEFETKPPVHTTYFTVTVDEEGKVATFKDLYGQDRKFAKAMFGSVKGFPSPPPEPKTRSSTGVASSGASSRSRGSGFLGSLGFFND